MQKPWHTLVTRPPYWPFVAVLVALRLADVGTTLLALRLGGAEAAPLSAAALAHGWGVFLIEQGALLAVLLAVAALLCWARQYAPWIATGAVVLVDADMAWGSRQ